MRLYSHEFRVQVVRRIQAGEKVPALSRELGIHRKLLYDWIRRVKEGGEANLRERGRPRKIEEGADSAESAAQQIAELERTVAYQQMVIDLFRQCLTETQSGEGRGNRHWRDSIFRAIERGANRPDGLSVETMCELLKVARSGYYRYLRRRDNPARKA